MENDCQVKFECQRYPYIVLQTLLQQVKQHHLWKVNFSPPRSRSVGPLRGRSVTSYFLGAFSEKVILPVKGAIALGKKITFFL